MIRHAGRTALGVLLLATSGLLHASPIHTFTDLKPNQNRSGGKLSNLSTVFNTYNDKFTWSYTVKDPDGLEHNGFWLVVNDGPTNPKGDKNLAILYGDLATGNVAAYAYDGNNNSASWENGAPLLQLFAGAIQTQTVGTSSSGRTIRDVSFTIDVTDLNALGQSGGTVGDPWQGVMFDDQLGIWFHATAGSPGTPVATFDGNGALTSFSHDSQGWIDTGALDTTNIPEPGVLHLSALGLIAFGASRRFTRRKHLS